MPEMNPILSTQVKGIIFDLDGTLYRMKWFMKPLLMVRVFPHCLRLPRFLKVRETFAGVDLASGEALLQKISREVAAVEKTSTEIIYAWIHNTFYKEFVHLMTWHRNSRPGINQVLNKLKNTGMMLGVLSDFDFVIPRLKNLYIDPIHFSVMTSSEASGALKPSPRPFLNFAQQWNLDPNAILVIGDRTDTDGAGARNAGMQFMQIHDGKRSKGTRFTWKQIMHFLNDLSNFNGHNGITQGTGEEHF